jgi:hypothetical protein
MLFTTVLTLYIVVCGSPIVGRFLLVTLPDMVMRRVSMWK